MTRAMRRLTLAVLLVLSLLAAYTAPSPAATPTPAHGGRVHVACSTVASCHAAIAWQQHDRAKLRRQLAAHYEPTLDYACRLGEVTYGVPVAHCKRVVQCESQGNRWLVNSPGRDTARGYAQFLPSTWASNPFGRAGFSIFDPVAPILGMDWYASQHGFNTSGGWAASHRCHGLS